MKMSTQSTYIPYEPSNYLHLSIDCPMSLEMFRTLHRSSRFTQKFQIFFENCIAYEMEVTLNNIKHTHTQTA